MDIWKKSSLHEYGACGPVISKRYRLMTSKVIPSTAMFEPIRLEGNPIVYPGLDSSLGVNINGPSLIKVPDWFPSPLGRYYLYFAHHAGGYIRLAFSDRLAGPWKIHRPGTLHCKQTPFPYWTYKRHIASPDVHIDHDNRRILMFYHGGYRWTKPRQATYVAHSVDGLEFVSHQEPLGNAYWRRFFWNGCYYAIAMGGQLYRSREPLGKYEKGPEILPANVRHSAVWCEDNLLLVFHSNVGDAPERILVTTVVLDSDWARWRVTDTQTVLFPRESYEGVQASLRPSRYGRCDRPVRELRDPYVFGDGGELYLLYSIAGEQGIAIAKLARKS